MDRNNNFYDWNIEGEEDEYRRENHIYPYDGTYDNMNRHEVNE